MWDASIIVGRLSLCYVEGLMLDPMCDTPHVQVTINALQRSSNVAESVLFHTHAFSEALQFSTHRRLSVSPRRRTTHSLKAIVYRQRHLLRTW